MLESWYETRGRADAVVILVALLARVAALIAGADAPTFAYPVVDAGTYDLAARSLAAGGGLDHRFFWQPFLYPFGLGGLYMVSGGSILAAKIVQLLVGVATCWFTLRVARRHLGPGTGLLAGLFCALHGPMIFFETELLATGWATFWAIVLLDRFTGTTADDGARRWIVTGLLCGIAVITRPTFLPAVIVAAAVVVWRFRALKAFGLAAVAFGFVVAPVAVAGNMVADHPGFLPASGAMNLYLGNHPEPCETLTIRPGEAWRDLSLRAKPTSSSDLVSNREYFRDQFLQNLSGDPMAVMRGIGRKSIQLVSSRELPRNVDPYDQREWSEVLSILMFKVGRFGFPMGLLLPLAVAGIWSTRRRLPASFFVFVGLYLLSVVAVFVSARYRMPMVPALSILAAGGVAGLVTAIRSRDKRSILVMGTLFVAFALVGSAPGHFCEEAVDYRAETLYAVAYAQHNAGEGEKAAVTYTQALEQRPDYVELINQFALLRNQQGRTAEAIDLWTRAIRLEPENITVRLNIGRAYAVLDRHVEAFEHYDAALSIDPRSADALIGSGFALLGLARFEEGVERLERGLQRDPGFASRMPIVIRALRDRGEPELAARLEAAFQRAAGRR